MFPSSSLMCALNSAVAAVCPIDGISIGLWDDRSTWRIDYSPLATDAQKIAGRAALDAFDILAAQKEQYLSMVNRDAEQQRLKVLSPGSGMALTYQEKFAQAQAVIAMGRDEANALSEAECKAQFPTLAASVGVEAQTLADVADLVILRYEQFAQISYSIERTRLSGKAAIKAATTEDEVKSAFDAIIWT